MMTSSIIMIEATIIIVVAALLPSCTRAAYDGTVLESKCSDGWDYTDARRQEIASVTNTLISGAKPGPPSAYLCIVPDVNDYKPDVWAWATCAESLAQPDCTQCVQAARDLLVNSECVHKAGAHMFLQDCSIEYDNYAVCHSY
ncbi:unnamed protein product [Linum trigynum]|uniref:Gnk2-homologous domain-containing protein n=1 Tax=Linum trigynum TaxID=586398 RepID=A0AAV2GEK2_9ROSI